MPHELGEPPRVHVLAGQAEGVAAGMGAQPRSSVARARRGRLQHPAQAGDVGLQRGLHPRRRLLAPDLVDQVLHRHRAPLGGHQQREQGPRLGPAEVGRLAVDQHRQLAEDRHVHARMVGAPVRDRDGTHAVGGAREPGAADGGRRKGSGDRRELPARSAPVVPRRR